MKTPKSVAIVAMGMSSRTYVITAAAMGGKQAVADQVWAINGMGGVIQHDMLFMMDDLSELMRCDDVCAKGIAAWSAGNISPIMTSKAYSEFPSSTEYPLEAVMNCIGSPYFNTTVAYAIAYAIYIQVETIKLYGCDFTYSDNHVGEAGRGCAEFLLGIAKERGIEIILASDTTLMDVCVPAKSKFYGYATAPKISREANGIFSVDMG